MFSVKFTLTIVFYPKSNYLGSCINAKGEATVTLSQYNQNRYLHGWGLTRTFLWLIGQQDLVEYRCLWTIMSIQIHQRN